MKRICYLLILLLASCGGKVQQQQRMITPETLYIKGMKEVELGSPLKAISYFERTEQEFPYSDWVEQAKIMQVFCYYTIGDYDSAVAQADEFIGYHPVSTDLSYVYYLRALSFYDRILAANNDQTNTNLALAALNDVANRFPGTNYAKDVVIKIDLARDHLAGQEMEIGRFYQHRGHLAAAMNRFQYVIDHYSNTLQVVEALFRMVELMSVYQLTPAAQRYTAILAHNYPDSDWTMKAKKIIARSN